MQSSPLLTEPSSWVCRWAPLLPAGGRVLDLACGHGRHARYLAGRGHCIEAVDADADALAALAGVDGVHSRRHDLESSPWPYGTAEFQGIVVTNYLHRPLFPALLDSLAPAGVLIYETFARGNEAFGRPSNPLFLLQPQELLELVRGRLRVVAFEEGRVERPKPAVVQRLCAAAIPADAWLALP